MSNNLGTKLLKGSAWMLGMRWGMRFIGLLSMSIVARLLSPDDFGVYAVVITTTGLLDVLTDIGPDISIIRHPNPQKSHYDTAWTLKVIVSSLVGFLIVLCSPLSNYIYTDPRYQPVLYVMAGAIFASGFTNIGIADFRRNLEYNKDFTYNLIVQVMGVLATIVAAYLLRSYWALVLGGLVRSLMQLLLSYWMHSYRPRFSLTARKEILGFSFWIMIRSLAMFISSRGDRLITGAFYSPTIIGWYAVAGDLAQMAVFELLHPIGRALLPGLASKQEDKEWERRNLKKIFNGTATLAIAMGLGVAALAEPAITLIYGGNFTAAAPLLTILVLASAIDGFSQPVGQYLVIHSRTKDLAILFVLSGTINISLVYTLATDGQDIMAICYARLGVSAFSLLRVFYLVRILQTMHWLDIIVAWFRPALAGSVMYLALWYLQHAFTLQTMIDLATKIIPVNYRLQITTNFYNIMIIAMGIPFGAIIYCSVLLSVWRIMGKPSGIEEEALNRLFNRK